MSFSNVAGWTADQAGSAWFFMLSLALTVVWLATGPLFGWSEGWNFAANSSTTVLTWLLAVLLLHVQNRDTKAIQLKLDELVHGVAGARDEVAAVEERPPQEIDRLKHSQCK
jgi:low affinity Fe/Cu permease